MSRDILDEARSQVLHEDRGLDQDQVTRCLKLPEDRLGEALSLAHEVRMRNRPVPSSPAGAGRRTDW